MPAKKLQSMLTIKDDLKNTDFNLTDLIDRLSEEEKKELLTNCNSIFKNSSFKLIIDDIKSLYIMKNAIEECTLDDHAYYRGVIHGLDILYEVMSNRSQEYLASVEPNEKFDPNEII